MKRLIVAAVLAVFAASCSSQGAKAHADSPIDERAGGMAKASNGPTIILDAQGERRIAPTGKAQITKLAGGENAFVGKLVMEGGGKVPLHRDATEEYIYILQGWGAITIDGKTSNVGPNTMIYMPANAEVSFEGGPEKLVALQVFAGPKPAEKYDQWAPLER